MLVAPDPLLSGRLPGMLPGLAPIQAEVVARIQGCQPAAFSRQSFPSLRFSLCLEDPLCFPAAPLLPPLGEKKLALSCSPSSRSTLLFPHTGSAVTILRTWKPALIPFAFVSAYTVEPHTLFLLLFCSGGC
jgi:hypothetical protein